MKEGAGKTKDSATGSVGKKPRVLLADRESIYLLGLRAILEPQGSFQIVGEATTSSDLLSQVSLHQPELLLMGFRLSCGRDALGLAPELLKLSQHTATIVLLPGNAVFLTGRLLSSGVRGLLCRCSPPEALFPTMGNVLAGNVFVDPGLSATRPRPDSTAGQVDASILTSRELEVLRLIGLEKSYKDIASLLGLSIKTVGSHRENIKNKLRLGSGRTLHLVARAFILWESSGVDYVI
jgi:DNA-binding NarL/FixJ family response regulator